MTLTIDNKILSSPLLEQMPGWMFVKDLDSKYTSSTIRSALLCGFKNQQDKYGKTDYELNCKASESAAFFQEQDRRVITQDREISFLQLNQYADDKIHIFITRKTPLKQGCGKIVGVCGVVDEVSNPAVTHAIFQLINTGKMDPDLNKNRKNFEIDGNTFFKGLSEPESVLVFYFMRGFSTKEIGLFMQLPAHTIENMLENLKNKFNCSLSKDFYNYCLSHQASNTIPHALLRRCMSMVTEYAENNKTRVKVSQRQQECINLLLTGESNVEIAQKLDLSPRTIETYIEILKLKFDAKNRTELVVKLCRYYP